MNLKAESNAVEVPLNDALAGLIQRMNYTDFMSKEFVLRCYLCSQVLQVGSDQMQAFILIHEGVLCKACELLNKKIKT